MRVVKIGGSTFGERDTSLEDISRIVKGGERIIIVHGGGEIITSWLRRMGVETKFEKGLRVTDEGTLKVAVAVLSGLVNKEIVSKLINFGVKAFGLSGADGLLTLTDFENRALGFVGRVREINPEPILSLLDNGYTPVIAPIGTDGEGRLFNINADMLAGELSFHIKAKSLYILTDVEGVCGRDGKVIKELTVKDALRLIDEGIAERGMIPKLKASIRACEGGCEVLIMDGREEGVLLRAFGGEKVGTRLVWTG